MTTTERPWFVTDSGFSRRLDDADRSVFMRVCPERHYARDEHIFREGDPADSLHVVAKGRIKLTRLTPDGRERILAIVGPDDMIGEAFLRPDADYLADAVALGDGVTTCPMSRGQFQQLSLQAPTFVLAFAEILAGNLFRCRDQLTGGYAPIKVRVALTLLEQARRFGRPSEEDDDWLELETELRHEEIASLIGATRVSVSSSVADLRNDGLVQGTRGRYRVHAPAIEALELDL
ncbi:MAG: Crp/Fnr family transcriptional regulator [Egibacteraceae bacterium]